MAPDTREPVQGGAEKVGRQVGLDLPQPPPASDDMAATTQVAAFLYGQPVQGGTEPVSRIPSPEEANK